MKTGTVLTLAAALAAAPPALAQTDVSTPMTRAMDAATIGCANRSRERIGDIDPIIAQCQAELAEIDRLRGLYAAPLGHELNMFHWYRATVLEAIGSLYLDLDDNYYTQRVCTKIEEAWKDRSAIMSIYSPFDYSDEWIKARKTYASMLPRCRESWGTPSFAAPLPDT